MPILSAQPDLVINAAGQDSITRIPDQHALVPKVTPGLRNAQSDIVILEGGYSIEGARPM